MTTHVRWTSADLLAFPDDGKRREIIDGELFVSKQPDWRHNAVAGRIFSLLDSWSMQSSVGSATLAPGLVFDDGNDLVPDVAWASARVLLDNLDAAGHLLVAPELVVEVLSPGVSNIQCDREVKLKLYDQRGVAEYWIVDRPRRTVDVFRRDRERLTFVATLGEAEVLTTPSLPGFSAELARVFAGLPQIEEQR